MSSPHPTKNTVYAVGPKNCRARKIPTLKRLLQHLGWDSTQWALARAVERKDHVAVQQMLETMEDAKSINRAFHWKDVFAKNRAPYPPLWHAIHNMDVLMMDTLLGHGAVLSEDCVRLAAFMIIKHANHADINTFVALCEKHKAQWANTKIFFVVHDRQEYYGTAEMLLLVKLKQQAFELGLFQHQAMTVASDNIVLNDNMTVALATPREMSIKNTVFKI